MSLSQTLRSRSLIALLICLGGADAARAQTTHVFAARVAVASGSAREDLLVPVAASGPSLALQGRYRLAVDSERIETELGFGTALLFDRFDNAALQIPHTVAIGYGHVIQRSPWTITHLGINVRWQTELSYFEAWDDAHGYWLSTLALGPTVHNAATLREHLFLETRAELALFGLVSRPPRYRWNKQDELPHLHYYFDRLDDAEAFWLWDVQAARVETIARARYASTPFGSGFGAGVFAQLARARSPEPYAALYLGVLLDYGLSI